MLAQPTVIQGHLPIVLTALDLSAILLRIATARCTPCKIADRCSRWLPIEKCVGFLERQ